MPSATFDQFTVVVVPFPFSDQAAAKKRPALVISTSSFNIAHAHRVLAMITTAPTAWPSDIPLSDLAGAGLPKPSRVRLKVFTLDLPVIVRRLGSLSEADARKVRLALKDALTV